MATPTAPCTTCAVKPAQTWADGFGIWHASVPAGPDAARHAKRAIYGELVARGEIASSNALRVERVGYVSGSLATRVEYREVSA